MKTINLLLAAMVAASLAAYEERAVTNTPGHVLVNSTETTLVAGTTTVDGYPSSVSSPQFWFDCSQTNGWTIAESAGVKTVTKIPSLVGSRYLSTSKDGGFAGFTWAMSAPVFETGASPLGGAVLDFGVKGSKCAMVFDPVPVDGGTATNVLRDIGTVIAVWYSAVGDGSPSKAGDGAWGEGGYYGGALLGGGYGTDGAAAADKSGYVLYRQSANTRQLAAETGSYRPRWFDNPFANGSHTHYAIRNGVVRQDGQSTVPTAVGMSGGWEVLSLVPNTDKGLFNATGLGVNYSAVADVSGGFKVAEMLIYDTALTVEETALVEAYLNAKWFSRKSRGMNGNAQIGTVRASRNVSGEFHAFDQRFDVPAGEKLTVGKFAGGRGLGEAGILKTGDGALELREASKFCGAVKMGGGSLEFAQRTIPDSLPRDPYLHFDVSDAASMVVDGEGAFALLRNLAPNGVYKTNSICARPAAASFTPAIIHNALGDGLDVLDFGDYAVDDSKRYLQLAMDETAELSNSVKAPIDGVTTIIALVGAHRGGGYISDGGRFLRYSSSPVRYDSWLLANNPSSLSATKHGTAFIDGLPADPAAQGYYSAGYQVVAIQTAGSTVSRIGGYDVRSGGLRLGEYVAYKRVLSEDEIRDASAYLMKKWLKRRAPGYDRMAGATTPDVQKVLAISDTVIDVAGGTARVGTLSSSGASVVKAGAGTLEIQKTATESLTVENGRISFVPGPDVTNVSQLADDPSLHLDVTAADTLDVVEVDSERRVLFWHSVNDRGVLATPPYAAVGEANAYDADAYCPYLSSDVQLNGHDTLDFGPYTQAAGGRRMALSKSFDSVRSAYVVWAPRDTNEGRPIGNGKGTFDRDGNSELYEFLRTGTGLVGNNGTANHVRNGEIYTNGVAIASDAAPMVDVFTLTEFHPVGGAHVSALATDRDVDRFSGGVRLAEVVLYERELSEREKVATRNYLMAKWFNAEPQALPETPVSDNALMRFGVDGEGGMSVDVDVAVVKLQGSGTFEKKGAETLSVTDMSDFSGEVLVSDGTLKIAGRRPATIGELPTDGLLYHADATWGLTTVTNDDGTVEVTEWKSKLDDGWAAVPFSEGHNPTLITARDLNGGKVVDMALGATALQSMRFVKDGEYALLDGISTVLWVIGSQNGGGYLLGGGTNYQNSGHVYNFMRGRADTSKQYYKASDTILNGEQYWTVPYNLRAAAWFKDGVSINPMSESLSGAWDLISMKITSVDNPTTCADGFAFDGRTMTSTQMRDYMGGQRLAEVLIYNRALDDDELAAAEAYLRAKWGFNGTQSATTNFAAVSLAEGTVLDLNATNQYFAALSGAGVVSNGVLAVGTLVADPSAAPLPAFDASAALAIEPCQRVVVSNASKDAGSIIVVFDGAIVGVENLSSAIVEISDDSCPGGVIPRLKYEGGVLFVKFVPKGSAITIL